VTLALLPTSQFPAGAFDVYYEIYNLPRGRAYTTEIGVQELNESGRPIDQDPPARLSFSGESAAGGDDAIQELRRVEASLGRGSYRLTVTVTDTRTGESASRTRDFEVRGSQRRATMVAALPHGSTHTPARNP
jgi:hypothetical protein